LVNKSEGPEEIEQIMNIMAKYGTPVADDFGGEEE
jgi:hypothetical protein